MEFQSIVQQTRDTRVEIGRVTHAGRTFDALGSVVSPTYAAGYPDFAPNATRGRLRSWDGADLGACRIVSAWRTPRSWTSSHMYQIEATIDGITYTGRGGGHGMLWRGRPKKQ